MEYLYLGCLVISIGMLFWLKLFDVRNSTTQFINLLIMVASNLGFYFMAVSTTLEESIMAQKIAYIGGIFLPVFYLFLVFEICHIEIKRYISIILVLVQCVLFGFVCTIGRGELFYKSVSYHVSNGTIILDKEYGPVHTLYPILLYVYFLAAFAAAVYSLVKRKSVNKRSALALVLFSGLSVSTYVIEKTFSLEFEIIPIGYVVLMFGALIPVYDSNLFTVYENKDIINEQLGKVGFLTFDKKKHYKGCNDFMAKIFPELSEFNLGEKVNVQNPELAKIIKKIDEVVDHRHGGQKHMHVHQSIEPFMLNDCYYAGMIHSVLNNFGKIKGYTIELRDETEHYRALALKEHYNEELSKEVDAKTMRIRIIQQKTILGMAQMVESRDLSTGGHIKRTSDVVKIFSKKLLASDLGFDRKFLRLVIRSAPMHDLGKIGVDDAVLRKQGRFTDEEYAAMKKHSEIGYHMVREVLSDVEEPDFMKVAENVAHYHHEKVDGSGYPTGLKGDEIPVEARIMALADVFDALVSKRCYKEAFSYDKAFDIIEKDAGTHFDKALAKVFLTCRPELEDYYNKSAE